MADALTLIGGRFRSRETDATDRSSPLGRRAIERVDAIGRGDPSITQDAEGMRATAWARDGVAMGVAHRSHPVEAAPTRIDADRWRRASRPLDVTSHQGRRMLRRLLMTLLAGWLLKELVGRAERPHGRSSADRGPRYCWRYPTRRRR